MVCLYDAGFTQMKWSNAREVTLRAVMHFVSSFRMADDEITVSVYVRKKLGISAIHSFTHTETHRTCGIHI